MADETHPEGINVPGVPHGADLDERLLQPETGETVDALLETVRQLLKDENDRDTGFTSRGVGLAGFVGIIVSLSTTVGRDALKVHWAGPWQAIAVGLFAAALVALVGTVIVVVVGVLRPRETANLGLSEVQRYPLPEYVYAPKVMNQGKTMRGLIEALIIERDRGHAKARGLRWGYRLLIVGLSCIAALGFLLGLHDAELIGASDGKQAAPRHVQPGADGSHGRGGSHRPKRAGPHAEPPRRGR